MNELEYTGAGDATTKGILTLKIILVGARHTGKGQIGRAWGGTTAD
ncbi:hypothetical protein GF325_11175, partial [Candidatus Bathyarchaeota archaeon]|nr:hypothetical protein [Candidatus Bathyarchaeota archaeon]